MLSGGSSFFLGIRFYHIFLQPLYVTNLMNNKLFLQWQDRIAEEVLEQYGENEIPSPFDRQSCPQLEAAIKETLRLACVLPVGFPHRTMEEVKYVHFILKSSRNLHIGSMGSHQPHVRLYAYTNRSSTSSHQGSYCHSLMMPQ